MKLETGKTYIVRNGAGIELAQGKLTASSPDTISIEGQVFDRFSVKIQEKK